MQLLTLFTRVPYTLANKQQYEDILSNLEPDKISSSLAQGYSDNLIKGVASVLKNDDDLTYQIKANTTRFAYYKAYKVSSLLNEVQQQYKGKDKEIKDLSYAILNTFNRYQASEYNTTISRCRTAKQWQQFTSDTINNQLFPNLRWIPSRSANPREAHKPFYNKVWAKNDPFWLDNQPGTLWNCKCDWEQTSQPVTHGNPTTNISQPGLRGNPAITGKIFSDDAAYFKVGNRKTQKDVEKKCESLEYKNIIYTIKQKLKNKITQCSINNKTYNVEFNSIGVEHCLRDCFGKSEIFWIKNQILSNIDKYIKSAQCVGRKISENSHNTKTRTLNLKDNTEYFYYFKINLPNKQSVFLHLGLWKDGTYHAGKLHLYSITKNLPQNTETI